MQYRVLVADDDTEIVEAISIYLEQEGYEILRAYNGHEVLQILKEEEVHLILLDIMMPQMDGLHALKKIREEKHIPVILISARAEDADKILGLTMGADDYVTKPFNPLVLLARVKSQLRRYTSYENRQEQSKEGIYRVGDLTVDDRKKEVRNGDELVSLTPLEYNIFMLFMKNPGRVFSGTEIYESVWKEDSVGSVGTVAVHIRHLREKIEVDPKVPRYLKVVWGLGYKLEEK